MVLLRAGYKKRYFHEEERVVKGRSYKTYQLPGINNVSHDRAFRRIVRKKIKKDTLTTDWGRGMVQF